MIIIIIQLHPSINIDPVLYIGISQSFFAGLLVVSGKPLTVAKRLMSAWLFLICIELIFALINSRVIEMYSFHFITFTYGPLLYLYVIHMTLPDRKFNWYSLLHFIPFVVFFVVSVIFRSEPLVRDLRTFFVPDKLISLRIIYGICFFLSITLYSILSFVAIRRHQANLQNLVSYTSRLLTLNWLKILSISFYTAYFVMFILGGLSMIGNYIPFDPYFTVFGFITIFTFAYSFYGIKQPEIFGDKINISEDEKKEGEKYTRSGLKEAQARIYLDRLLVYMDMEKPYLKRDLSIHDLSLMTDIPRHYLTQTLNEYHKKSFFEFINEYRVNEVIARFRDQKNNSYTILAIAYDSGFNSKTTFNAIFKVQTGMTPSRYREQMTGISE
jgi:AraC-like DNA-binding protein